MARTFVTASSQYLAYAGVPVTAVPVTLAAWVKPVDVAAQYGIVGVANSATGAGVGLVLQPTTGKVMARVDDTVVAPSALSTTSVAVGVWTHVCGVFAGLSSRAAFVNGGSKGTDTTTTIAWSGLNVTELGDTNVGAHVWYLNGDLAEVAIWTVALDDAEVASLAAGVSPLLVRPTALAAYWPLLGRTSPEIDLWGRRELTVIGATASAHPRIAVPAAQWSVPLHLARVIGITKDRAGLPLGGCVVHLFRTADDVKVAATVSDGAGVFSFAVPAGVAHYAVAYLAGSPDVAGTTVNTLVGV